MPAPGGVPVPSTGRAIRLSRQRIYGRGGVRASVVPPASHTRFRKACLWRSGGGTPEQTERNQRARATALGQGSSPSMGRGSRSAAAQYGLPTWGPGARPLARGGRGACVRPPTNQAGRGAAAPATGVGCCPPLRWRADVRPLTKQAGHRAPAPPTSPESAAAAAPYRGFTMIQSPLYPRGAVFFPSPHASLEASTRSLLSAGLGSTVHLRTNSGSACLTERSERVAATPSAKLFRLCPVAEGSRMARG